MFHKRIKTVIVFQDSMQGKEVSTQESIHCGNVTVTITTLMLIDGFLFVEELLAHPQFRSYSPEDVKRVVATNDKQRFKLRSHPEDGRLQVRASQGHSLQVNV